MDRQKADRIARRVAELCLEHVEDSLLDGRDYGLGLGIGHIWPDFDTPDDRGYRSVFDLVYANAETDEEKRAAAYEVVEALAQRIDRQPGP